MTEDICQPFETGIEDFFSKILNEKIDRIEKKQIGTQYIQTGKKCFIQINGVLNLDIVMILPSAFTEMMNDHIFEGKIQKDASMNDLAYEFINIVAGTAKRILSHHTNSTLTLGLPSVNDCHEQTIAVDPIHECYEISVHTRIGNFSLFLLKK